MKSRVFMLLFCLLATLFSQGQDSDGKTPVLSKKDIIRLTKFKARGIYPLIRASKFSGVLPMDGITERPDSTLKYKLLFSFSLDYKDAEKMKELNRGLAEIGRIINLHIAGGVRKENLEVVVVAHGKGVYPFLKNEAYKKEFKTDNPSQAIITEMENAGVKFIACSQSMQFLEIDRNDLAGNVKLSLSAKTALSTYLLKGYALFEIDDE